jgi:3-isopropylmalate/(R)-2-methylmalate dehydratase large subunit
MGQTLFEKVFNRHIVRELAPGQYQLFIGLHLIHEVTSPQAFEDMRERRLKPRFPSRTFATADHAIPTDTLARPYADPLNEAQVAALERNVEEFGIRYFGPARGEHGIVHVIGPERGLTQPGMTIVCGDSHTSTHGAFGALAFGIGTSQVRDVLATQTLTMQKLKVRRIEIKGRLAPGVYAKDVALHILRHLGVKGGVGYAYEFVGDVVERFSMDERMTLCNMSIEGGARCGYVNPDQTTYDYLRGREYAPAEGEAWDKAVAYWNSIRSDDDAVFDDVVTFRAENIGPMVTWGITPDQSVAIDEKIPPADAFPVHDRPLIEEAHAFMSFEPGRPIDGTPIDVAFIGSCTNGRLSDFELVAGLIQGRGFRVAPNVKALIVPGSQRVRDQLMAKGLDKVFTDAGFEFREAGCSMCLALNTDKLEGRQVCASSSNRNFKGRQGSPTGRTLLMSPAMVAAAAIAGKVTDARMLFEHSA